MTSAEPLFKYFSKENWYFYDPIKYLNKIQNGTLKTKNYQKLYKLGKYFMSQAEYNNALIVLKEALKAVTPGKYSFRNLIYCKNSIGECYLELKMYEDAQLQFQAALHLEGFDYWTNYLMGLTLLKANRFAEAIKYFRISVEGLTSNSKIELIDEKFQLINTAIQICEPNLTK